MPLDPSNFVGIWCCDGVGWNGYALILRPDGVGRAEMSNVGLTNAWTFDWSVEDERLRVKGREAIQMNDAQDDLEHLPWEVDVRIPVRFGSVSLGDGSLRRTLLLDQQLLDCLPQEYVAGNSNFDVFAPPDFSWILGLARGN